MMSTTIGNVNNERLPLLLESLTSVPDVLFLRQAFIKMESSEKSVDLIVINRFNNHWNNTARDCTLPYMTRGVLGWIMPANNRSCAQIWSWTSCGFSRKVLPNSSHKWHRFTEQCFCLYIHFYKDAWEHVWLNHLTLWKKKKKLLLQPLCTVKSRSVIIPPFEINHNLHCAADDVITLLSLLLLLFVRTHIKKKKSGLKL